MNQKFSETDFFLFEKKTGPVRFESGAFTIPGSFVLSRPGVPEMQKNEIIFI